MANCTAMSSLTSTCETKRPRVRSVAISMGPSGIATVTAPRMITVIAAIAVALLGPRARGVAPNMARDSISAGKRGRAK